MRIPVFHTVSRLTRVGIAHPSRHYRRVKRVSTYIRVIGGHLGFRRARAEAAWCGGGSGAEGEVGVVIRSRYVLRRADRG